MKCCICNARRPRPRGERSILIERILFDVGRPMRPCEIAEEIDPRIYGKGRKRLRDAVSVMLNRMWHSKDIPVRKTGSGLYAYDETTMHQPGED